MLIGVHQSISGGCGQALERVVAIGGNCLQIFSSSPRDWQLPKASPFEAAAFILEVPGFDDKGTDQQNLDILKSLV